MKKLVFLATSALLLAACSEKPGYEITGSVADTGLDGEYVYLYKYATSDAERTAPMDSALVQNGTFTFKGAVASPTLSQLIVPGNDTKVGTATFVLENAKLTASLGEDSQVGGTVENDQFNALNSELGQLEDQMNKLEAGLRSGDIAASDEAEQQYDALQGTLNTKAKEYISANAHTQTAAVVFYNLRYSLNEEEQNAIVAAADSTFKAVPGIGQMIAHLDVLKNSAVGKKFIDFDMADTKGKAHKLSEYVGNGKVVLIDFWASWCPPCRREMPNLVKAYKEYKGKNFEIVGISLDSKLEAWEKGIKDLGITWPQLSDLQGWKNTGAALYGVNSIPHTVLVDKDGTVLAKNLHGEALDAKLKEVLK